MVCVVDWVAGAEFKTRSEAGGRFNVALFDRGGAVVGFRLASLLQCCSAAVLLDRRSGLT